jgi:alkylhydroperoxidase family enzyme
MLRKISLYLISRAEKRLGIRLDYTRFIAKTNFSLLLRYNRLFGFLDPNRHVPPALYHAARIIGALSADCGTCVQAELNLARSAGMDAQTLEHILAHSTDLLDDDLAAILTLAHHVTAERTDHSDARAHLRARFGDAGLIELAYAMNVAALLPGIKRALGYATTCDMDLMAKTRGLRT